jgi:hypothetical protein
MNKETVSRIDWETNRLRGRVGTGEKEEEICVIIPQFDDEGGTRDSPLERDVRIIFEFSKDLFRKSSEWTEVGWRSEGDRDDVSSIQESDVHEAKGEKQRERGEWVRRLNSHSMFSFLNSWEWEGEVESGIWYLTSEVSKFMEVLFHTPLSSRC